MGKSSRVFIGVGANVGDREANIRRALELIAETGAGQVVRASRLVETEPLGGPPDQGAFLNGAIELETGLEPRDLLAALKRIEQLVGRVERERWGPREIDLDILLFSDEVVKEEGLHLPHPMMCDRLFVLAPLAEIAGDAVHPVTGRTIREHLEGLRAKEAHG